MQDTEEASVNLEQLVLTRRERQVLTELLRGLTNRQIAEILGCGARTVQSHVSRILRKARVSSRMQLVLAVLGTTRGLHDAHFPPLSPFVQGSLRRHLSHHQRGNSPLALMPRRPRLGPKDRRDRKIIPQQKRTRTLRRGTAQRNDTSFIVSFDAF